MTRRVFCYYQTYNSNTQTPDSAGTATAFLTGAKTNYGTIGVRQGVARGNCEESLKDQNQLRSYLQQAMDQGTFVFINILYEIN